MHKVSLDAVFNSENLRQIASVRSRPQNLSLHDSTVFDSNKAAPEGNLIQHAHGESCLKVTLSAPAAIPSCHLHK